MIEFGILGPLVVRRDGQDLPVPTAMLRRLLLVLLAWPGQVMSVDFLADVLWDGDPPATARRTLAAYFSRLRGVLGVPDWVVHEPAGYRVRTDFGHLDSLRFEELLEAAGRARIAGDVQQAGDLLREALGLWRGQVLDGIRHLEPVLGEVGRLEALRLRAWEDRLDADLECGRHAEVEAELVAATRTHPYSERLRGLHMLALFRCGRQADALDVYRRTYQLLTTELGIEPTPELQHLHRRILEGDPALSCVRESEAVNQLPMGTRTFVGRERDLAEIAQRLAVTPSVVAITGIGGIGKTSLAVRAAGSARRRYPDGCVFVDLRGADPEPSDPHAILGVLLRSMGVGDTEIPPDPDERIGLYRSTTARRRLLIVLDNASGPAQVRPLLPAGDRCAVVITSRRSMSILDAELVEPEPLSSAEAEALLAAVAGRDRIEEQPAATAALVRYCGGIPLAVRVVAARLAGRTRLTPQRLATILSEAASPLAELSAGDVAVAATLTSSYRYLSPSAARLVTRLAVAGLIDFTPWHATVLLDDLEAARDAVDELLAVHLATAGRDRLQVHDLVREMAARFAIDEDHFAVRRMAQSYLALTSSAADIIKFGRRPRYLPQPQAPKYPVGWADRAEALAWAQTETANVLGLVRHLAGRGEHELVWLFAAEAGRYLDQSNRLDEWQAISTLGLAAAEAAGDPRALALVHIGDAHRRMLNRQHSAALESARAALAAATESEDTLLLAYAKTYASRPLLGLRRAEEARVLLLEAAADPDYRQDSREMAYTNQEIGIVQWQLGHAAEAYAALRAALEAGYAVEDLTLVCFAHHNLADALMTDGHLDEGRRRARPPRARFQCHRRRRTEGFRPDSCATSWLFSPGCWFRDLAPSSRGSHRVERAREPGMSTCRLAVH